MTKKNFCFSNFFSKVPNIHYFITPCVNGHRYVDKMNFKYRKISRVDSTLGETKTVHDRRLKSSLDHTCP